MSETIALPGAHLAGRCSTTSAGTGAGHRGSLSSPVTTFASVATTIATPPTGHQSSVHPYASAHPGSATTPPAGSSATTRTQAPLLMPAPVVPSNLVNPSRATALPSGAPGANAPYQPQVLTKQATSTNPVNSQSHDFPHTSTASEAGAQAQDLQLSRPTTAALRAQDTQDTQGTSATAQGTHAGEGQPLAAQAGPQTQAQERSAPPAFANQTSTTAQAVTSINPSGTLSAASSLAAAQSGPGEPPGPGAPRTRDPLGAGKRVPGATGPASSAKPPATAARAAQQVQQPESAKQAQPVQQVQQPPLAPGPQVFTRPSGAQPQPAQPPVPHGAPGAPSEPGQSSDAPQSVNVTNALATSSDGASRISLRVEEPGLGVVRASFVSKTTQMAIRIYASNDATHGAIEQALGRLHSELAALPGHSDKTQVELVGNGGQQGKHLGARSSPPPSRHRPGGHSAETPAKALACSSARTMNLVDLAL